MGRAAWGRLVLVAVSLALVSCTRLNPEFDESADAGLLGDDGALTSDNEDEGASTTGSAEPLTGSVGLEGGLDEPSTSGEIDGDEPLVPPTIGPFNEPQPVFELNSNSDDDDPSLTEDLLEIVFASLRDTDTDRSNLWFSTRASVDDPWNLPEPIVELNTDASENTPELSLDGLTMTFGSDRDGNLDIYLTTRTSRDLPWGTPQRVDAFSTTAKDYNAFLSQDQRTVYVCSELEGASDLYVVHRLSVNAAWGPPQLLEGLSAPEDDCVPWVDLTDSVIVYASSRTGTNGAHDLWFSWRDEVTGEFLGVQNITELNSNRRDDDPWLSPDGRMIFFASNRGDDNLNIYVATRQ